MSEAARDAQVARETVRPRSECPHCNPGAQSQHGVAASVLLDATITEVGDMLAELDEDTRRLKEVDDFDTTLVLLQRANAMAAEAKRIAGSFHDRAWALRGEVYGDHHHPVLGVVSVRRTAKSTKWDDESTAERLIEQHMEATGGELVGPGQVVRWVLEAASVGYWRVGALKALGIDPDDEDLRFKQPGNPTITFPSAR